MKRLFFVCSLFLMCGLAAFAQTTPSFGSVDNADAEIETIVDNTKGFSAQVDIDTNLFQLSSATFTDAKNRDKRADYLFFDNYPFGGFNILDDTNVAFGYNAAWYGGNLTLNKDGLGGIKAWISFLDGKIKVSAGSDIGYGYADAQGADAGLRVYDDHIRMNKKDDGNPNTEDDETIDSNQNPDNITQDEGVLFEFDLDPVKIAIAGGGNIEDIAQNMGDYINSSNTVGDVSAMYGHSLQYGVNVGTKIAGDIAKVNASYVFQSVKDKALYQHDSLSNSIKPFQADAHVMNHLFGLYASVYPFGNETLGITLGYAGIFTENLDSFTKATVENKTLMPTVFKNGINLTARYQTEKLTIKTDHNFSFWSDKNYKIYYLYKENASLMKDFGLEAKGNDTQDKPDVNHYFIWNGIGASYRFSPLIQGSIYVRNLIRIDDTEQYSMVNDYFSLELKSTFYLGENVEAYAGFTYNMTSRFVSKSLAVDLKEFKNGSPKATTDVLHMFKIPIGVTVKLR